MKPPACFWDRLEADIKSVERLNLGPNDRLVITVKGHISNEAAANIKEAFGRMFPHEGQEGKVIVVEDLLSLSVLSES